MKLNKKIRIATDVGGTFTDLILIYENQVFFDKVPSTPGSTKAVLNGIDRITTKAGISKDEIGIFVHGFTIATNAFLTRNGATISLAVSKGYRDTLEIGNQRRPHLYHMTQVKPKPVVPRSRIIEVVERLDSFGNTVIELSNAEATELAKRIANEKPEAIAICLSFSYLCPNSEEFLRKQLKIILPAVPIYISSEINSQVGEYKRANTTAIAAYIGPITDKYVGILANDLVENGILAPLRLMRSDGGVATPQAARENPVTMLLSGLAGGVIAGEAIASELDVDNLVTFDMGGTSADFSVIVDGEPRRVNEREINGQPIRMQSLDIETISAGGGSLAYIDLGGALRVGPQSAGALPGPVCYGTGGEDPTTTDAIVALGILDPDSFLGGELKLDADLAISAITRKIGLGFGSIEQFNAESAFSNPTIPSQKLWTASVIDISTKNNLPQLSMLVGGWKGILGGEIEFSWNKQFIPEQIVYYDCHGDIFIPPTDDYPEGYYYTISPQDLSLIHI